MSARLQIRKTYKLFIGGNFVRSESGRYLPARARSGESLDNVCHASRKDFRDGVSAARVAFEGWAGRSAPRHAAATAAVATAAAPATVTPAITTPAATRPKELDPRFGCGGCPVRSDYFPA